MTAVVVQVGDRRIYGQGRRASIKCPLTVTVSLSDAVKLLLAARLSFQFALSAMEASKIWQLAAIEVRNCPDYCELAASNWFPSRQGIGSSHNCAPPPPAT